MRPSSRSGVSASARATDAPPTPRPPSRPCVLDAGTVGPLAMACVLPEGPATPVSPVAAPSAQSERRRRLLDLRVAPSFSEARSQLGKPLSSLLFASLNKRDRQLFGLEPLLRGKDHLTPSVTQLLSAPGRLQRTTADAQVQADAPADVSDPVRARTLQKPLTASLHDRACQHVAILKLIQQARANKKEEELSTKLSTSTVTRSIADTFGEGYARWYKEISSSCKCSAGKKEEERYKERKVLQAAGDPIQYTGKTKSCQKDLNAPPNSLVSSASKKRRVKSSRGPRKVGVGGANSNINFPKKYGIAPAPTSKEKIEDWLRKNWMARYVHTRKYLSKELASADSELIQVSSLNVQPLSQTSRFQNSPIARADMYSYNSGNGDVTKRLTPFSYRNVHQSNTSNYIRQF